MNSTLIPLVLALAAAPAIAFAGEGEKALRLTPKEAIATATAGRHAPFVLSEEDPTDLDFVPHPESRRGSPSSCDGERTLCYDPTNGHIVYKPVRQFMPDIPGLQRENISVNRHRILFKYSF
ncbi:MAG TPA: hypothetical protein VFJ86_03630 [Usitatibacter sp.]|jgi:hypothetical protein|nr:hypothetical protein [Usitatibacter sp.]